VHEYLLAVQCGERRAFGRIDPDDRRAGPAPEHRGVDDAVAFRRGGLGVLVGLGTVWVVNKVEALFGTARESPAQSP
jgi:hypothetical protein